MAIIVDAHQDIAYNALNFGRDYCMTDTGAYDTFMTFFLKCDGTNDN